MSENSKSKVGFLTAFQVAAVWFGAHVGGGFATGNQTMNFFVKYGWHSIWLPAVIVIIIGLTYRESLILAKNYGTYDYKSWSKKMYEPYDKVFSVIFEIGYLMIVLLGTGGSIAGSASLMENYGVNYLVGVLITGGIFYILTIYGSELIRKASTIITVLILIFLTIIVIVGIVNNSGNLSHLVSTKYSPSSFGTVLYSGLRYAGYQAFVVAIVLSASDTLKSDKAINKSMTLGIILNGVMITLSCIMLLAWMPGAQKETIPILYICKRLNSGFLLFSYSVVLFLAFVSTGIGCVFGAVARFEHVFKKPENIKKRRGLISLVCMVLSMAISLFGLTKIVVVGYGYVGIIGIFAVVIPCIVVGRIKNNRFKKEKESILLEEQNDISNEYQNSASVEDKSDMLKEKDSALKEEQDNISKKDKDIASKEDKDDVLKEEDSELIEDQDDISEEDEENVPAEGPDNTLKENKESISVEDQVDVLKGEQDSVPEDADDTLEEDKESVSIEDQDDILKEEQDSVSEGEDDTLNEDKENVAVEGQDDMQKGDKESISIEKEKSTDDDASKEDEDNISVEDQDNI
ncbi:YkvI family membrane protein [Clostridium sp. CTA-1]